MLIIVIVKRRRNNQDPKPRKSAAAQRNVIAFENPMYETRPAAAAASTSAKEHEGLYDEPAAFVGKTAATAEKANPLYDSAEKLDQQPLYDNKPDDDEFRAVVSHLNHQADGGDGFVLSSAGSQLYGEEQATYDNDANLLFEAGGDDAGYLDVAADGN